jgi:hypothetical protein
MVLVDMKYFTSKNYEKLIQIQFKLLNFTKRPHAIEQHEEKESLSKICFEASMQGKSTDTITTVTVSQLKFEEKKPPLSN